MLWRPKSWCSCRCNNNRCDYREYEKVLTVADLQCSSTKTKRSLKRKSEVEEIRKHFPKGRKRIAGFIFPCCTSSQLPWTVLLTGEMIAGNPDSWCQIWFSCHFVMVVFMKKTRGWISLDFVWLSCDGRGSVLRKAKNYTNLAIMSADYSVFEGAQLCLETWVNSTRI